MNLTQKKDRIKLFKADQELPYHLLLLADETIEAIDKYIHDSEIYIYERDQKTIGIYACQLLDGESLEIKNIAVSEEYQGEGIGQKLLSHAISNATKRGFKNLMIGTSNAAFQQLYIYQKMGFRFHKVLKDFFTDNYKKEIVENGLVLNDMLLLKKDLQVEEVEVLQQS
ncbi:GNAT family N-acetyltransferase [Flammeovirga sp. MY04]|uniref:GNAT family N-acetyltransferase n=1 Tax=Flammeovirga sp. MY04 TaxID=1191459 RepID=UPI0008062432|nr:GNAT family N-acetyltransferase [Flammeovirga sp. MY04]ANQ51392.1 GNAT family N-acetyltransferase [Flammeovirga sp. MY04]